MTISLAIQLLGTGLLCLLVLANRQGWGDPQWPLMGLFTVFLLLLVVCLYVIGATFLRAYNGTLSIMSPWWPISLLFSVVVFFLVIGFVFALKQWPPIHDISTDLEFPPTYTFVLPLRHASHNSLEYDEKNIIHQQTAYAHIQPLFVELPPSTVIEAIQAEVTQQAWQLHGVNTDTGSIEVSERTALFGFVDDMVIRVRPDGGGSRVDMRSISRIGQSDFGANARRIQQFLQQVSERLKAN